MELCYRCNQPATSVEHAPPRCLFPESKDLPGTNLRQNLITVPSCDLHNQAKSTDDEFLMVSLAGVVGNNSIGYSHKFGKVDRALRRRSFKLLDKVITKKQVLHNIELADNNYLQVLWGTPDFARLQSCFESIAYAIHRHHYARNFEGQVRFHLSYLIFEKGNPRVWNEFLSARAELDLQDKRTFGSNPDVFTYQVSEPDKYGLHIMKLSFYGGLHVYCAFIPAGSVYPDFPGLKFIEAGINTVMTLGDKEFHFSPTQADPSKNITKA